MPKFQWKISGAPKIWNGKIKSAKQRRATLDLSDQLRTMSSPMPSRAPTAAAAGCEAGTPSTRGALTTATTTETVLTPQRQYGRCFWFGQNVPGWRLTYRACWPWVGIDLTECGCAQFNSIQWRDSAYFQAHTCKCACVGGLKHVLLVQPGDRDMARPHEAGICRHPPYFRRPVITLARPAAART